MAEEFIGAISKKAYYIQSLRAAFEGGQFNICQIHHLPDFDYKTFANWVQKLHCERGVSEETLGLAKCYCVNYFLCPESQDEFEVEAYMREVFPPDLASTPSRKPVLSMFGYALYREVA